MTAFTSIRAAQQRTMSRKESGHYMLPSALKIPPHGAAFHLLSTPTAQARTPDLFTVVFESWFWCVCFPWWEQAVLSYSNMCICLLCSSPLLHTGNKGSPLSKAENSKICLTTVFAWSVCLRAVPCLCSAVIDSSQLFGPQPGSPVHGISQARTLEWVAVSSSRDSSSFLTQGLNPHLPCLLHCRQIL